MDDPPPLLCRRVRSLLWNEIAALLNPGERDVVRKSIGAAVIEDNEVLFREAVAYEEILQFVDEDMQCQVASHKILNTPTRQMVEKEIKVLVEHIHQSQAESSLGQDDLGAPSSSSRSQVLDPANSSSSPPVPRQVSPRKSGKNPLAFQGRCKSTLDYVLSKDAIQEKQRSRNPSQFPPCRSGIYKRSSSSCGNSQVLRKVAVDPSLIVKKIAPHLNVAGIDAVSDRLRHAFAAEHEALLEDVDGLRRYLEDSVDVYSSVKNNPPSINEMKDCGKKLEETWAAVKHCQSIQSILAPVDRIQGGKASLISNRAAEPDVAAATPHSIIPSEIFPGSKRSIRLPKMER